MYRSVMEPCEWPALSCTYACGLPAAASCVRAVWRRSCHGRNGFSMRARASAGRMYAPRQLARVERRAERRVAEHEAVVGPVAACLPLLLQRGGGTGPSSSMRREERDVGAPKRPRTSASRTCRRPSRSSTSLQRRARSSPRRSAVPSATSTRRRESAHHSRSSRSAPCSSSRYAARSRAISA
jgi:hypothetical protein